MSYKGHVSNGVIVLDDVVSLEDGTSVAIEVLDVPTSHDERPALRFEHYQDIIGSVDGLPEDWSENHDKYLRQEHAE